MMFFHFFFSSRRRHTRSTRDWSSDVCSSDLLMPPCPAMSAAVAPTRASAPLFIVPLADRGSTMSNSSLAPFVGRRNFLKASAAFGGGLILSVALPSVLGSASAQAGASSRFAPNAFIGIDRQGVVTLVMPMVEMGQGTYTSLAMLLAEELEVSLSQVRLEHAPPNDALYANAILHSQATGLSSSIRAFWT